MVYIFGDKIQLRPFTINSEQKNEKTITTNHQRTINDTKYGIGELRRASG
ncbi:MAG: hypothetical protein ACJAUH_001239 [Saprospiraceae bacterium]|jgi:hypothetical protein